MPDGDGWFERSAMRAWATKPYTRGKTAFFHRDPEESSNTGESMMLGLFAMLLVSAAVVVAASYWIFWEMQHAEQRPQFTTKVWNDFAGLFGRKPGATQMSSKQSATA